MDSPSAGNGFRTAIPCYRWRVDGDSSFRVPVLTFLFYDRVDPMAARLSFRVRGAQWVDWVFGRELLAGGLTETVGAGDVHVRSLEQNQLRLTLSNRTGTTDFDLSRTAVQDAVQRMLALVPAGTETRYIDWDRELDGVFIETGEGGEHAVNDFNWPDPPN